MADRLFPHLRIREDDIFHFVVALEKIDCALEESLEKAAYTTSGGIVAQHLGHILIDNFPVHLLEADESSRVNCVPWRSLKALMISESDRSSSSV